MNLENANDWDQSFKQFYGQFGKFFQRSETRHNALLYLRGLLADIRRKNCWQLAEAMGLPHPRPFQRLLDENRWNADLITHHLRLFINRQIGYVPGVGVIDESGFVKKGMHSAGVARQYCGRIGKVENCQVGVFLGYVTPHGSAFLDRRLYLPQGWCDDGDRRQKAAIPEGVRFQTKPQLAQEMLEQVWTQNIPLQWVTGDTIYGNSPGLRNAINRQEKYYVLAIANHHEVILVDKQQVKLKEIPGQQTEQNWLSLASRISEKGLGWYDWIGLRVTMPNDEIGEQWLLVRRTPKDEPQYTFYLSNAPEGVPLTDLVAVANARHSIEELLEEAKSELGLADYEARSWDGWHRHMTLVMLVHTWLKLIQHHEREKKPAAELADFQLS